MLPATTSWTDLNLRAVVGERKYNHLICMLCHLERLARVATLSARRPVGLLALTLRCPRLVLAWWLTRRLAVPIELRPDRLKFGQYLGQLGFQTCAVGAGVLADALLYPIRRVETRC